MEIDRNKPKIINRMKKVEWKYLTKVVLPQVHYWYGTSEGILRRYYARLGAERQVAE